MTNNRNIAIIGAALLLGGGVYMLLRRRGSSDLDNQPSLIDEDVQQEIINMSTNPNLPRGYRNNNPLNIRYSMWNAWKGKIVPNTDGTFEQFKDMAYGYRAALSLLRTYIKKYGCNTVAKIIQRWAPENENNTQAYIQHVCEIANLLPNMAVTTTDRDTLTKMAYAMSIIENGKTDKAGNSIQVTYGLPNMDIINEGWRLL